MACKLWLNILLLSSVFAEEMKNYYSKIHGLWKKNYFRIATKFGLKKVNGAIIITKIYDMMYMRKTYPIFLSQLAWY